jgi:DNA-binding CsgD family transcriptional regulator
MDTPDLDRIHSLWDELADFDASRADVALDHLMAVLAAILDAQNANWFGSVRMADNAHGDVTRGWRARALRYLHPVPELEARTRDAIKKLEQGKIDVSTARNIELSGTFRVNRLVDLASEAYFDSDDYRRIYSAAKADAIWAGIPINADAECHLGIFRDDRHPRFTPAERDLAAYALRPLTWFHRRQMLSRAVMVASAPLTEAERDVLSGLLSGATEKEIAAARSQSPNTVHGHVTAVYRKYGVNNRAALMALWLGRGA